MKESFLKKIARVAGKINQRRYAFVFCLVFTFFILYGILSAIDFVPETKASTAKTDDPSVDLTVNEAPTRLIASTIGLDLSVQNPPSRNIEVLDDALLAGPVHYPGSANMADSGTMFFFGHSSHLPVVHNQNFKAFNGIENLKEGDLIHVQSATEENVYSVSSVTEAPAETIRVDLTGHGKRLVLSTCNSFGGTDSRYVVEADFVASYSLSNNP
jgi:LPXTG-site transpeptidase (sortase) family protein